MLLWRNVLSNARLRRPWELYPSAMNQQPQRTGVHEMCPPKNHMRDWMRTLPIAVEAGQCIEPHLEDYFELSLSTLLMSLESPRNGSLVEVKSQGRSTYSGPSSGPSSSLYSSTYSRLAVNFKFGGVTQKEHQ